MNKKHLLILVLILIIAIAIVTSVTVISENHNKNKELIADGKSIEEAEEDDDTGDYTLKIDEVFPVIGSGNYVIGTIKQGTIDLLDEATLIGKDYTKQATITGIQKVGEIPEKFSKGDKIIIALEHNYSVYFDEFDTISNDNFTMSYEYDFENTFSLNKEKEHYETYITGTFESGDIKLNDTLTLPDGTNATITDIRIFSDSINHAEAGDKVKILLRGINKEDLAPGYKIQINN